MIFSLDKAAAVSGGARAGQYLQSIGQTDLAKLNVSQFEHFCDVLVTHAWRAALDVHVAEIENNEPPF